MSRALWVVALLALSTPASGAEMYRWVDERGGVHYAGGIDAVPERFRAKAVRLEYESPGAPPEAAAKPGPGGPTVIRFEPGKRIYVQARLNGLAPARLMLDTGADRTVIAPRALSAAGISLRTGGTSARIQGATGMADVEVFEVESIQVGGSRVGKMLVIAHDINDADSDGLLGRDFLDQFKVTIDNAAGHVTLAPK